MRSWEQTESLLFSLLFNLLLAPNPTSFPPKPVPHAPLHAAPPTRPLPFFFNPASPLGPAPSVRPRPPDPAPSIQPRLPTPPLPVSPGSCPRQPPQYPRQCHLPARFADRSPTLTPSLGASSSSGRGMQALAFSPAPSGCLWILPDL